MLAERRATRRPSAAGVPPKLGRDGAGCAVRPTTWCSCSSNSPIATACGSSTSSAGREDHRERHPLAPRSAPSPRPCVRLAASRSTMSMIGFHHLAVLAPLADRRDPRVVVALDIERRHIPAKSASDVGVTMPHPSWKRIGRKPATKLDGHRAVGVEQHLVAGGVGPQERHDRVDHRQLEVLPAVARSPGRTARR